MFESVEQLEKEVKDFQKNILASSELIRSLESLIAATKAQKEDFAAASSGLVSKMDSHTEALRESYEEALEKLVKENRSLIKELTVKGDELLQEMKAIPPDVEKRNSMLVIEFQKYSAELQASSNAIISQLCSEREVFSTKCNEFLQSASTNNKTHLTHVAETINTAQQAYIQRLEAADASIVHCEAEINHKYEDFLTKLESTNVDQMFKMCQDIKKSMDTKFLLLSVGVGASIVLMIVSLFIR